MVCVLRITFETGVMATCRLGEAPSTLIGRVTTRFPWRGETRTNTRRRRAIAATA
jgi:hypothetical protein